MIYYKNYVYKAQNSSIFLSINEKKEKKWQVNPKWSKTIESCVSIYKF